MRCYSTCRYGLPLWGSCSNSSRGLSIISCRSSQSSTLHKHLGAEVHMKRILYLSILTKYCQNSNLTYKNLFYLLIQPWVKGGSGLVLTERMKSGRKKQSHLHPHSLLPFTSSLSKSQPCPSQFPQQLISMAMSTVSVLDYPHSPCISTSWIIASRTPLTLCKLRIHPVGQPSRADITFSLSISSELEWTLSFLNLKLNSTVCPLLAEVHETYSHQCELLSFR